MAKKANRWEVIHEDECFIVVNKPAKYLVIPDRYDATKPSIYGMLKESRGKIYINHRIDMDTSGLLVLSKTEKAHKYLSQLFEQQKVEKVYEAIAHSTPTEEVGLIDLPILQTNTKKGMVISDKGKPSQTKYRIIDSWGEYCHLQVKLLTGRQHQIRLHLRAINCPLLCDKLYGDGRPFFLSSIKRKMKFGREQEEKPLLSRQALHASSLAFEHMLSGERMEFNSELPKDMRAVITQMSKCY